MAQPRAAVPPRMLRALGQTPQPLRDGPPPPPGGPLDIAVLRSALTTSGLDTTLELLGDALRSQGHTVSVWPVDGGGLKEWKGADVALAAGWRTVPSMLRLPDLGARVFLAPDDEPELYAAGADREWAAWTYGQGLHAICAGDWLAAHLGERYGLVATPFLPGVDHEVYRPLPTHRRGDLVLFHAPPLARRGLALGVLALQELHRRRPEVEIGLYGAEHELRTPFPHTHGGVLTPPAAAGAYSAATVGLSLSFTAPSAVVPEMLACGLAVVESATDATRSTYGSDVVQLSDRDPMALADAIELVLDDLALRADRSRAGMAFVADRTWNMAAEQVQRALRAALDAASS